MDGKISALMFLLFGSVHAGIGTAKQRLDIFIYSFFEQGVPGRERKLGRDFPLLRVKEGAYAGQESFQQGRIGVPCDDGKFIPADPIEQIIPLLSLRRVMQRLGGQLDIAVAGGMAEGIVDHFQRVQIYTQHTQSFQLLLCLEIFQVNVEGVAVFQLGEQIGICLLYTSR